MIQRSATIAILLPLAVALSMLSCREEEPQPPASAVVGDIEEREARAAELLQEAAVAPVPEKVKILRRLVGRFPETSIVPTAYARMVFYLVHRSFRDGEEAFRVLQIFAGRHPDHPDVVYAFSILDGFESGTLGDPERRQRLRAAWGDFLGTWLERHAGAAPRLRLPFLVSRGELAKRQGRMDEVVLALGEIAIWADDPALEWDEMERRSIKNAIVNYACALGMDPAGKDAALAAFRKALEMSETGVRGFRAQDIRAFMAELEQTGRLTPRPPDPGVGEGH